MWHNSLFEAYWRWFRLLQRYEFGRSWYRCEFCIPCTIRLSWASLPGCSFIKRRFWQDSRNHPSSRFTLATLISRRQSNARTEQATNASYRRGTVWVCAQMLRCKCAWCKKYGWHWAKLKLYSCHTISNWPAPPLPFCWVSRKSAQNSINRFIHDILKMRKPIA